MGEVNQGLGQRMRALATFRTLAFEHATGDVFAAYVAASEGQSESAALVELVAIGVEQVADELRRSNAATMPVEVDEAVDAETRDHPKAVAWDAVMRWLDVADPVGTRVVLRGLDDGTLADALGYLARLYASARRDRLAAQRGR